MADEVLIDLEVTLFKKTLMTVINESKLPITVKALVVSEFNQAVSQTAEAQVLALLKNAKQDRKEPEVKEVEKADE